MAKRMYTAFDPEIDYRASQAIAQGALTNSKRPSCLVKGVYPTHLTHGQGAYVYDTKGKQYVDFIAGLGSNLLGYGHTEIADAIAVQARRGGALSLGTVLEIEAAEQIKGLFPFIDRLRFLKTGSEACSAAVRIARAKTGRMKVLTEGYHGWHDEFVSVSPPALGVGFHPNIYRFDKGTSLADLAAVIIEPVMTDNSPERIKWLRYMRDLCTFHGIALIFDEVITGFRFPKFSVSNYYGIQPDLICLGKVIGGGMPLSIVGGSAEFMDCGEYFVSSTFAGETMSLAAMRKVIDLLHNKYKLDELWEKGQVFLDRFNALWPEKIRIDGYPTRGTFAGDPLTKALFWQEACRAGLLFGPSWFFTFPHIELMDSVLNTAADIVTRLKTGSVKLEGELPSSPFAQRMREANG